MQSDPAGNYRSIISRELARYGYPLPVELVEAVIKIESGGVPGLVNSKSGATGLGQVMPVVLSDYCKANHCNWSIEDLKGSDDVSISRQISVAVWVLGRFWKSAYNYLSNRLEQVPLDELTKIADLFYVAGPGAKKKKLGRVSTPTYAALEQAFPTWNAFRHTQRLLKSIPSETQWQMASISEWLHGRGIIDKLKRDPATAGVIAVIALVAGSYLFFRR